MNNLEIINLGDRPDLIRTVSEWLYNEWRHDGRKIEDVIYRTSHCLGKDDIPQTFIACIKGEPVGTVSLWRNDLKARQDLFPWMAALYVLYEYRNKGIGTKLQRFAIAKTKQLGYKNLYLTTNHEGLYEKMGWRFLEIGPDENEKSGTSKIYLLTL